MNHETRNEMDGIESPLANECILLGSNMKSKTGWKILIMDLLIP